MIGCQDQHRQAPRPFAVPSGLHALRSDPDDAGSQVASADAAFLPYAAGATAVRRCFRTGLTNEGSHEGVTQGFYDVFRKPFLVALPQCPDLPDALRSGWSGLAALPPTNFDRL